MSRPRAWIAGGLLLGIGLQGASEAPADVLPWLLDQAAAGSVRLEQPEGSLWSGSAAVLLQLPGRPVWSAGRWHWTVGLGGWLQPAIHLASDPVLSAGAPTPAPPQGKVSVLVGWGSVRLQDLDLHAPADALPVDVAWWTMLQARGMLDLQGTDLLLDTAGLHGSAMAGWRDAGIVQAPVFPLGHWQVALRFDGSEAQYALQTVHGPLMLNGSGRLALDGRFSLQGSAQGEPAVAASLLPLLSLLGAPDEAGRVVLSLPWPAATAPPRSGTGR